MPNYPYTFQLPPLNVQDIPNDGVAGEFLGINGSGVLDWLPAGGGGTGDMLKADNLSGLASYPTARTNLGLGTSDSPTFANLTLTSPSLSSSAPVTISQTWNAVGQTFKALVVNAAGTSNANSASGSLLADFQVGGVSQFSVSKVGAMVSAFSITSSYIQSNANFVLTTDAGAVVWGATPDTWLRRDGAPNTLALRNGTSAQTFNVYGTYSTSPSLAYARLAISCDTSGNATLTTQSTGVAGTVSINGVPVGRGAGNDVNSVAIGTNAVSAFSGGTNVAVGVGALQAGGTQCVSVGYASMQTQVGSDSIGIGWGSMYATQPASTVALGTNSGRYIANGSTVNAVATNSIFIGGLTKALDTAQTNQIVIGHAATGIGSNSVVLGNDSITKTALKGNVGIGTTNPTSNLTVAQSTAGIGTVSIPIGNNAVTGVGTQFLDTFKPGDFITISGQTFSIASISSNTALIATPGAAATYTNQPYTTIGGTRFNVAGNGDVFVRHPLIPKLRIVADAGSSNLSGLTLEVGTSTFAGFLFNPSSGETRLGAFITGGYFQTFYTENAERMRILANGNVGIGTTSPTSKLHVAETWNAVGTTFTAVNVNVTDTASAATSKLLDLQIGGASRFSVDKVGIATAAAGFRQTPTGSGINVSANGSSLALHSNNAEVAYLNGTSFVLVNSANFGWAATSASSGTADTILLRDGAGQLALRNSTNSQTFNLYSTYTDSNNYQRLRITPSLIASEGLGTGAQGAITVQGSTVTVRSGTSTSNRIVINTTGLVGIGVTGGTGVGASKVTVQGGDVEVTGIGNGIILADDVGNRRRITITSGGSLVVSAPLA